MLFYICLETRELKHKIHHKLVAFVQNNMRKILANGDAEDMKADRHRGRRKIDKDRLWSSRCEK